MAKLTQKKAVEMSIELWQWLYDNPLKYKFDYPKYNEIEYMTCACPCCEIWEASQECPLSDNEICGICTVAEILDCAYTIWETNLLRKPSIRINQKSSKKILDTLKKYYEDRWGNEQK